MYINGVIVYSLNYKLTPDGNPTTMQLCSRVSNGVAIKNVSLSQIAIWDRVLLGTEVAQIFQGRYQSVGNGLLSYWSGKVHNGLLLDSIGGNHGVIQSSILSVVDTTLPCKYYEPSSAVPLPSFFADIAAAVPADMDKDGLMDFLVLRNPGKVSVIYRNQNSSFVEYQYGSCAFAGMLYDYTGDGVPDVLCNFPGTILFISPNRVASTIVVGSYNMYHPCPGDFDGDGDVDIVDVGNSTWLKNGKILD